MLQGHRQEIGNSRYDSLPPRLWFCSIGRQDQTPIKQVKQEIFFIFRRNI
jgi:hypothetical protein